MLFRAAIVLWLFLVSPCWSTEYDAFPDLDRNDPAALREATRVLEEELKLAARPHTYLLLDLPAGMIRIKGRGVDLHRISLVKWIAPGPIQMTGTFRLIARPPVVRRKIDPSSPTEQEPISLADMPTDYPLSFTPPLRLDILAAREEGLLQTTLSSILQIWQRLKAWGDFASDRPSSGEPSITLTLSVEEAQSLAWSTVDGMALIVRQPTDR